MQQGKNGKIIVNIKKDYSNKQLKISVQDDGKGIDKGILHILFQKFTTKTEIGTGLGLYISKKIVEAHGGTISGYNNPDGKGATFEFTLLLENSKTQFN